MQILIIQFKKYRVLFNILMSNICHNFCFQVESECDGIRTEFQFNSDDFGQNNSQLALPPDESLETENYRREFFAMLEDVVSLGGDLYNLEWLGNVQNIISHKCNYVQFRYVDNTLRGGGD